MARAARVRGGQEAVIVVLHAGGLFRHVSQAGGSVVERAQFWWAGEAPALIAASCARNGFSARLAPCWQARCVDRLLGHVATAPQPVKGLKYPQTSDAQIDALVPTIRRAMARDLPRLIRSETGTGEELLAHAIHNGSRRAAGSLAAVNCFNGRAGDRSRGVRQYSAQRLTLQASAALDRTGPSQPLVPRQCRRPAAGFAERVAARAASAQRGTAAPTTTGATALPGRSSAGRSAITWMGPR
ncbi:MAG: sigma 54-interacting transcriptional regulator [Bacteriovorax sp.]|nr:sigma 54-interacting transcriptional regulator [Rhizobacter sp.]